MNIGKKVILFFILVILFLSSIIVYTLQNRIDSTKLYEEKILISNIKKFQNVLNLNAQFIKNIAYNYTQNKNIHEAILDKKRVDTLSNSSFMQHLGLSYFALFDKNKNFIQGHYYDISSDETLPIPNELKLFIKGTQLDELLKSNQNQYITISFEKLLFTIQPVQQHEETIGYIFVARTLDSSFLTSITEVIQDYTTLISSHNATSFTHIKLLHEDIYFDLQRISDEYILSHIKLEDVFSKQPFYIRLQHQRSMYQELMHEVKWSLSVFSLVFIVLIAIIFIFMNRLFTKRIQYITNKIKQASKDESLEVQLQVHYNDELSYLCRKINEMFDDIRLHQSRSLQRERDFLQSVLDTQENIIMITDGKSIQSTNKKFHEIFKSKESFFNSIALLDKRTKSNLVAVAKRFKNQDKAAKFKVIDEHRYFTFDVSRLDIKQYLICMNDVSNLNEKINYLEVKASIDELTGVYNKSTITQFARNWLLQKQFCLMIFDIDYFKKINDTYGHYVGDCVLRDLSKCVANVMPNEDIIGRFGGEEFVVLVNVYTNKYILQIAQRIREVVQNHMFVYDDMRLQVTISIGCTLCQKDELFTEVYKRADKALYKAKETGRNKVELL